MHKLLAEYISGEKTKPRIELDYLVGFSEEAPLYQAPNKKVYEGYFSDGLNYIRNIGELEHHIRAVEKEVNFQVGQFKVIGFIDVEADGENGVVIADHKSRKLVPKTGRAKKTKSDLELDEYFKQLYLYAEAIFQETGVYPDKLAINSFRNGNVLIEDFDPNTKDDVLKWFHGQIDEIENCDDFPPSVEYFKCRYLCDVNQECEYFNLNANK